MVSVSGSNEIAKDMAVADHSVKDILFTKYLSPHATIEDENILDIPNCAIAKFEFQQKMILGSYQPTTYQCPIYFEMSVYAYMNLLWQIIVLKR